ncbi:MAG: Amine oxidase [flavin-containing], partial [uncultured Solirubrobacteraceae bacterium]
ERRRTDQARSARCRCGRSRGGRRAARRGRRQAAQAAQAASAPTASRRRRRRRRRTRGADRRARPAARRTLGPRPRGTRPRWRARVGPRPRPRVPGRELRARRDVRRADAEPHHRTGRRVRDQAVRGVRRRGERRDHRGRPLDLQRHRPDRHRAARPSRPPRARRGRRPAQRDVEGGARRRAVARREGGRVRRADARDVHPRQLEQRALPQARARRDAADLRCRAARALAALRPLLHRGVGRREECRDVRAELQHPRRRTDVPHRGRVADDPARRRRRPRPSAHPAALPGSADRSERGRRRRDLRPRDRAREALHRRPAAGAVRPHRLPARAAVRPRPARPARGPGHADQGHRGVRPPVLAREGAHRHRPQHARAHERHVRRLSRERHAGCPGRLRRRRRSAHVHGALGRRAAPARPRRARRAGRRRGAARPGGLRDRVALRAVEPRRAGRHPSPRDAPGVRRVAARAGGTSPLGRDGDVDLLERLHGRRRALRAASGDRGTRLL